MSFGILLLLAIVQGLTEFLPVSSSGHLVLLYNLFGIENNVKLLSIMLHIATLLSVIIYYRKDLIILIKHPLCPTNRKIIVTTISTCILVLIIKPLIDSSFNGQWLFAFFLVTAILLFISDFLSERQKVLTRIDNSPTRIPLYTTQDITHINLSYSRAIIIGLTQGIACIPGISRSGSTIAIGRMCGIEDATRYSFLISIPIIIASLIMELFESGISLENVNILHLIVSMIICFVIGLLCIKVLTKIANAGRLTIFSYYLIGLSTVLIILSFV